MSDVYLLNKPFNVLSTFTDSQERQTLANFIHIPNIYAAGRLDFDSEGLMILTADGAIQHRLANPKFKLPKRYWVQVEGEVSDIALSQLETGVNLKDGQTRPAKAKRIDAPDIWERSVPIRQRQNQPTSWIELEITEGRNRQVRRMTAATGFPTLRLIRVAIGSWSIEGIAPGEWRVEQINVPSSRNTGSKRNSLKQRPQQHPKTKRASKR